MQDFQKKQAEFASHIRSPDIVAAPGDVEDRRMKIYRDLFFNNIRSFISGGFPIFKSLFNEEEWDALVRGFFSGYKSQTPYFLEISEEFLTWLDNDELAIHARFPFAKELTHYEWVELKLDVADELPSIAVDACGNLLTGLPVISALAWPLAYQWPVHMICSDFLPQEPSGQSVCLIVYRDSNDKVEFLETNSVTLRLLEIINSDKNLTGEQALKQLHSEMPQGDEQAVIDFGLDILKQLRDLGVILGVRKSDD